MYMYHGQMTFHLARYLILEAYIVLLRYFRCQNKRRVCRIVKMCKYMTLHIYETNIDITKFVFLI